MARDQLDIVLPTCR